MAKVKCIPINTYKRGIYIFAGKHEEFVKWIQKEFANDRDFEGLINLVLNSEEQGLASFWWNGITGDGIIEIPKIPRTSKEIAYCAHECLHATFHVLDYAGVEYVQKGSNESFTYLHEQILYNLLITEDYKTI